MNIYLVGFMGSGKSAVGPILARLMGREFADTDALVGDIPGIFRSKGEEAFRDMESAVISSVSRRKGLVVSLGGGALLRPENRAAVGRSGKTVYLRCAASALIERLSRSKGRPLLAGGDLRSRIEELMKKRRPHYEKADITVRVGGRSVRELAEAILRRLKRAP
ncbi:MAG: shikimate kinase [Elusimicrobiota bacterium]